MDYGYRFTELNDRANSLAAETQIALSEYKKACKFTSVFLGECESAGIKAVTIGVSHKCVPSSVGWPFSSKGSVFAMGKSENGWPAIWGVVERLGISGSCGNSDQHAADTSNLVDGAYELKSGKWIKL